MHPPATVRASVGVQELVAVLAPAVPPPALVALASPVWRARPLSGAPGVINGLSPTNYLCLPEYSIHVLLQRQDRMLKGSRWATLVALQCTSQPSAAMKLTSPMAVGGVLVRMHCGPGPGRLCGCTGPLREGQHTPTAEMASAGTGWNRARGLSDPRAMSEGPPASRYLPGRTGITATRFYAPRPASANPHLNHRSLAAVAGPSRS